MNLLTDALATPQLGWLVAAVVLGGLARGFSGFGTALIFMPVAAAVVPPFWALTIVMAMDFLGTLPQIPRALREFDALRVGHLLAGFALGLAPGLWLLTTLPVEAFRWAVSAVVLGGLVLMVSGLRYDGPRGGPVAVSVGVVAGLIGGATGISGPPVILYCMASAVGAAMIRANLLVYFVVSNLIFLAVIGLMGRLDPAALMLAGVLVVPFALANLAGAAMFRPGQERVYRAVAYALIAAAALVGLPIWG